MLWWPHMNLEHSFTSIKAQVSSASKTMLISSPCPRTDQISGNLYASDSTGSRFTLSLTNHLVGLWGHVLTVISIYLQYQVFRHPMGHYSVYDFYEVLSMRGVYITTVVEPGMYICFKPETLWTCIQIIQGYFADAKGHVTKITFDNGGMWSRLSPPTTAVCVSDSLCDIHTYVCKVVFQKSSGEDCSLHLHLRYSQMVSPFYNSSRPKGPLSITSAPMIIIAHG